MWVERLRLVSYKGLGRVERLQLDLLKFGLGRVEKLRLVPLICCDEFCYDLGEIYCDMIYEHALGPDILTVGY